MGVYGSLALAQTDKAKAKDSISAETDFVHKFAAQPTGIVNDQFSHMKMVGRADFVQLINTYCLDVESILSKLESYIDLPKVDFSKLAPLAAEVGERSSR
ncbi:hypothetical protein CCACVL1_19077 [Corchorus capsularis]|uniref:Uncharacterized protein n=1 Tax=Corchorus capsularis TaxID=210143 RepID=A0A1R3HII2_COCAP|nr:hypothetical protein CCACVL1_19077 [Corchorus capsularis]